jgi:uncharacterized Zn finger protein
MGQIGSVLELLQGKLSHHVMEVITDHTSGLFPNENEIDFECSCPDWAGMCKHVAAVLYGVGNRLDDHPELLFLLRGVDTSELIDTQLTVETTITSDQLDSEELEDIFGIDFETIPTTTPKSIPSKITAKVRKEKKVKKGLDVDKLTGTQLQDFRKEMGLTVEIFAATVGLTPASIYRWENSRDFLKLQARSKAALLKILQKSLSIRKKS